MSGVLKRIGMGRLGRIGLEPARRYERSRPGELVHVDVKKLGRIARPGHRVTGRAAQWGQRRAYEQGWEYVHIAIDDATRLAYVEVLSDEWAATAIAFFKRALRFFARYGIEVERVMSDNGACYRSKLHALCCRLLGIRHLRTRACRPQTNGKAERFIRTLLGGRATERSIATRASTPQHSTAGSGITTISDHTKPSAAEPPQLPSPSHTATTCSGLTASARAIPLRAAGSRRTRRPRGRQGRLA